MIPPAATTDRHATPGPADEVFPDDREEFVPLPEEVDPWWLDLGVVALPGM